MTIKDVLTFLGVMVIFYLLGSFTALSFNPNDWQELGRYMFSFMGTGIAAIITAILKSKN